LWALTNYPYYTVSELVDTWQQQPAYVLIYEFGRHSFTGILLFADGEMIARTVDNGQGTLVWKDID
jgi:hypothetical protein